MATDVTADVTADGSADVGVALGTGGPIDRPTGTAAQRDGVLDGLRGLAIVLVLLSHSWVLWSFETIDEHAWLRVVFRNGDGAVTVFLVVSGYLAVGSLSRAGDLRAMRPGVVVVRRALRVLPSVAAMLAVLCVVAALDPSDTSTWARNRESAWRALTFTYNWFVQDHLLAARFDLGHLWYLSVDLQAFVITAALLFALRRRRVAVVAALAGLYLLLVWWRFHLSGLESPLQTLVRTSVRMDAFVVGALAASVVLVVRGLPHVPQPDPGTTARTGATALVLLAPLLWWCASDPRGSGDHTFLTWGGTLLELDLALLVGCLGLAGPSALTRAVTAPRVLRLLGRRSLVLYVWHYPVFAFVDRHTPNHPAWWCGVVGIPATVLVCVVADRLVDTPTRWVLARPGWRALDVGWPAYVGDRVGRLAERARRSGRSGPSGPRPPGSGGSRVSDDASAAGAPAPAPGGRSRR